MTGTKFGFIHTYIHTYIHFFKTYYSDSRTSKTSKLIKIFELIIFTVTKLSLWESKTAANSLALSFLKLIYRFLLLNWNSKNKFSTKNKKKLLMNFNNKTFFFFIKKIILISIDRCHCLTLNRCVLYIWHSCKIVYYAPMDEKTLTVHAA